MSVVDTGDIIKVDFESGEKKIEKEADVSLGDGQYEVILTKTDTNVTPGNYDYEIWWVLSSGEQYVLEKDRVKIKDSIYKS